MSSRFLIPERRRLALALTGAALGVALSCVQVKAQNTTPTDMNVPYGVIESKLHPEGTSAPNPLKAIEKKYEGNPTYIAAGKAIYDHYNCVGCHFHGGGGMGPPFMNGGHWKWGGRLDQIFASIYQGRGYEGMPAWGQIIPAAEIWEISAYVKSLSIPSQATSVDTPPLPQKEPEVPGGNAEKGAVFIAQNGCGSCHIIPGIKDATGIVGPPLEKMARRAVIAGVMPNTPGNMMAWISDPQAIVPGNAMPDLGLSADEVRDITAYIYTLH
jgi:mono/diheme cytochrome c family protein